jgi:hypothetical protein
MQPMDYDFRYVLTLSRAGTLAGRGAPAHNATRTTVARARRRSARAGRRLFEPSNGAFPSDQGRRSAIAHDPRSVEQDVADRRRGIRNADHDISGSVRLDGRAGALIIACRAGPAQQQARHPGWCAST